MVDISDTIVGKQIQLVICVERYKEETRKFYDPIFDFIMKAKELFIIPTWVFILMVLMLAVSIGMNIFQGHIIKEQFDFLKEDVTLFRRSMNLMDSLETANHGLFDKLMELKEYQIKKDMEDIRNR